MSRNRSYLAFLVASCLLLPAAASGQSGATMDTASMLASPTLSPEARQAIRERVEAVHAKFRERHGGLGPEQFGLQCCQITQIPAAAFEEGQPGGGWVPSLNGYVFRTASSSVLWAPVLLPSGVEIQFLDLFHYDSNTTHNITATLWAFSGGGPFSGPPADTALGGATSSGSPGYGYAGTQLAYTVNNNVAFDPAAAQLVVIINTSAADFTVGFKAVDIWWMRQISPAPLVATFSDVPTSHPFFQFIEALAASGITLGCDLGPPPLYCPDLPVTRAQMAAFLARAFGLYWPL